MSVISGAVPGLAPERLTAIGHHIAGTWKDSIVRALTDYVRIPNVSRAYNPDWATDGHMQKAIQLMTTWIEAQALQGATCRVNEIFGQTPVIVLEIPATLGAGNETILLYGHGDKQPGMDKTWRPGLGPWTPVIEGDRLYGRGSSDDGYAVFSSVAAIKALQQNNIPHPRIVVLIEFAEESGSPGLEEHVESLAETIGQPDLIICLDSGAQDYDRMWLTTSLRGMAYGFLRVDTLTNAVHSGMGGGVVPEPIDVIMSLVSRLRDPNTFQVIAPELGVQIPQRRRQEAEAVGGLLGSRVFAHYPLAEGTKPLVSDPAAALLRGAWESAVTITGIDGLPPTAGAGNVIQPSATVKVTVRLPPTLSDGDARKFIEEELTREPPFGARVTLSGMASLAGWHSPELSPGLTALVDGAATAFFGHPVVAMGEGGSIPFMGMLGRRFPEAQFIITGVLGPESNAHGPDEFLHIPYATRLTQTVAAILAGFPHS